MAWVEVRWIHSCTLPRWANRWGGTSSPPNANLPHIEPLFAGELATGSLLRADDLEGTESADGVVQEDQVLAHLPRAKIVDLEPLAQ